nr:hypothetical protein [Chloroflexia bacterium]
VLLTALLPLTTVLSLWLEAPIARAQVDAAGPPLDLAALLLRPADLPEPGYGLSSARLLGLDEEVAGIAAPGIIDPVELSTRLTEAGWQRRYVSSLIRLADPADPTSEVEANVLSTVTEYVTAEGASAGFALLDGELERQNPSAVDLPNITVIGEESELTRVEVFDPATGDPLPQLNLTFRVGNLIGDVLVADPRQAQPDEAQILSLGQTLLSRFEAESADTPGLGSGVLRLRGDAAGPDLLDAYTQFDGIAVPLTGDTPATLAAREAAYGEATDVYEIRHSLNLSGEIPPYYHLTMSRYTTTRLAAAAIDDPPTSTELVGSVETALVSGAQSFGDESQTYSYLVIQADGSQSEGFQIAARVGERVALLELDGLPAVPLAVVEALVAQQVACMEAPDKRCEPAPVPADALLDAGFSESSAGGDPAALQPASDAGVDGASYTSPTHSYTIAWDLAIWNVSDVTSQDGFDQLVLSNGPSSVYIEGYADGAGDPTACLTENIATLRAVEGVTDYKLREDAVGRPLAGGDSTRAFATYDLAYLSPSGERAGFVNFVECRTLVPGESVVVITLFVAAEEYESELPVVEELLTALTLPGAQPAATPLTTDRTYRGLSFTLSWNESWTPRDDTALADSDRIVLDNGMSIVTITGTALGANETLAACVESVAAALAAEPRSESVTPVTNAAGSPIGGEDEAGAFALYRFTTDATPSVAYIECRPTLDGASAIQILQLVPEVAYNDQITARRELLDTLES